MPTLTAVTVPTATATAVNNHNDVSPAATTTAPPSLGGSVVTPESIVEEYFASNIIPRLLLPADKAVSAKHVDAFCGKFISSKKSLMTKKKITEKEVADAFVVKLHRMKKDCQDWVLAKCQFAIIEHAQRYGFSGITSWSGLKESIKSNMTEDRLALLWHSVYGEFDFKPNWEFGIESSYLEMLKLEYEAGDEHGCVKRIISSMMSAARKAIDKALPGESFITIKRENVSLLSKKERNKKRPKGTTIDRFGCLNGIPCFKPHEYVQKFRENHHSAIDNVPLAQVQVVDEVHGLVQEPLVATPNRSPVRSTRASNSGQSEADLVSVLCMLPYQNLLVLTVTTGSISLFTNELKELCFSYSLQALLYTPVLSVSVSRNKSLPASILYLRSAVRRCVLFLSINLRAFAVSILYFSSGVLSPLVLEVSTFILSFPIQRC